MVEDAYVELVTLGIWNGANQIISLVNYRQDLNKGYGAFTYEYVQHWLIDFSILEERQTDGQI